MNKKPPPAAKKAAAKNAPAKTALAGSSTRSIERKQAAARKTGLSTYVGKAAPAKASVKRDAPAAKKSGVRAAFSGELVGTLGDRPPNARTQAAMVEARQLAAAFKKRHGLS